MEHKDHKLPIGTILDKKYKILNVIGSGGFGITYQAEDIFLNELYVIKEFFLSGNCVRAHNSHEVHTQNLEKGLFDKFKQRFLEEAKILHRLKKVPSIIEVTAFFEENNTGYLVMPFVAAEDLEKYLRKQPQNRISQNEALTYFEQIAIALAQIHEANIIHRDIKPANILIDKKGAAYLIDFGAARAFIAEGLTQTMTAILTPGYAPLEQYDEQAKRGPTTDIYAMGALLYRMLTGKNPINAISRRKTVLESPHSLVPAISLQVSDAIMKALEMEAEDRFQSAREMMDALQGTRFETPLPIDKEVVDWNKATQQNTLSAYQRFLKDYPNSRFKTAAQGLMKALEPETEYRETQDKNRPVPLKPAEPLKVRRVSDNDFAAFWQKYKIHTLSGLGLLALFFLPKLIDRSKTADREKETQRIADSTAAEQAQKRVDDSIAAAITETYQQAEAQKTDDTTPAPTSRSYTETVKGVSFVMKAIPGRSFYMGETEVTRAQFAVFIAETGYRTDAEKEGKSYVYDGSKWTDKDGITWRNNVSGNGSQPNDHPVIHVSWNDSKAYCAWLSKKTGRSYRLPEQAEWEYAAKGGQSFEYAGSNNIDEVAWYDGNSSNKTHPVKQKKANGYGIYDMSGNVWEWCEDLYSSSGSYRVRSGGSLGSGAYCHVADSYYDSPNHRSFHLGFRLSRTY